MIRGRVTDRRRIREPKKVGLSITLNALSCSVLAFDEAASRVLLLIQDPLLCFLIDTNCAFKRTVFKNSLSELIYEWFGMAC
jgi:hypothetical protein